MSTAARVPETFERSGDDPRETLATVGKRQLLEDALTRLRAGDGTSHSRSLAFMVSLILVQGLVIVIGLATLLGDSGLSSTIEDTIGASVPGPASDVLTDALRQARRVGHRNEWLPLVVGLLGVLVTATIAMGQTERGLNRIYGIDQDRPTLQKYRRALVLALTAGPLFAAAFLLVGLANEAFDSTTLLVLRWPVALALITVALSLLLRFSPNRCQPSRAWLAFGSLVAVGFWAVATILLALSFALASTFPRTYGPLAGVVALLLWSYVSTLAIFYGVSVAAQLESVRAHGHGAVRAPAVESSARAPEGVVAQR